MGRRLCCGCCDSECCKQLVGCSRKVAGWGALGSRLGLCHAWCRQEVVAVGRVLFCVAGELAARWAISAAFMAAAACSSATFFASSRL